MDRILDASLPRKPRERSRVIIGLSLWLTMSVVWVIASAMTTGLPLVGSVAWANDQDRKVDSKIDKAVHPLNEKIVKLEQAVTANNATANSLLASVTGSQIRATFARLCREPGGTAERERLEGDLERFMREYPKYTDGNRYPAESLRCGQP